MRNSPKKSITIAAAMACVLTSAAQAAMTVSNAKTKNVTCTSGVCTPTRGNANLNVGDLVGMLASSDVTVKSNASTPDIGVLNALTWASDHRLALDAYRSIHVRAPVVVEGTAGVMLTTNDGGTGGDYDFNTATSGSITFWDASSSLIINGANFTLVKDIATLATDIAANASGTYALANNYDATVDGVYSNAPIGALSGALEGLGNTIQNLSIATNLENAHLGLIAHLQTGGTIRDINLTNVSVSAAGAGHQCGTCSSSAGTLADLNEGIVARVNVSGSVSEGPGLAFVGGIVSTNVGTIVASSFAGKLYNNQNIIHEVFMGGIAGSSQGSILQSSAIVDASGGADVGGLVGASQGTVALSHASGIVSGLFAGGLVGLASGGTITQSFSSADVVAREYGGGLVGFEYAQAQVTQSYSTGAVSGEGHNGGSLGGFVGRNEGMISRAYATGMVSPAAHFCTGGFTGASYGPDKLYSSDYWDTTTTQQQNGKCSGNIDRIIGLTDDQLKSGLPAGFHRNVWGQSAGINNGWPYLLANPPQ